MVYAKVGMNYTLRKILKEKDFIKLDKSNNMVESDNNLRLSNDFIPNHWYTFHNEIEAKIIVALKRSTYYELIKNKISDENNLELLYGEILKSLPKTKRWLENQEIKYPEYFL